MLSSYNSLVLKKLFKRTNVNISKTQIIKRSKGHLSHSQLRIFESKSKDFINHVKKINNGKRYYSNNHKPIMEKGDEAPCRIPMKKTNRFKFLDLLFYKKLMNKVDSRWDKPDYLGIEKLYKDFRTPEVKDEDNIFKPYPKRSWWHRPYYYRSFDSFMLHKDNIKRLKKYAADALIFRGQENKRGQFLYRFKEVYDLIKRNTVSITQVRLREVVHYLQYLKEGDHGFEVQDNEHILSMEDEIQKQAAKYRVAWREDWKSFWREYPPLEPWETPRSLSDPDPHILLDLKDSVLFNDIIWNGSGQEDFIFMIDKYKKSKNPLDVLKYSVASHYLSDRYRDYLIKLREKERYDRFQLGSIHRGAMDVIFEYMPGWNHATHTYDYGRRLSMTRTMREEEEIMARYPDPLSPQDRNESVPPYMEMLFQWRSFPDPVFSKFAYIDPVTHTYQLQAHLIGDEKGASEMIPDIIKRRTTRTPYPRHWLYIFSTREGLSHEMGDMPNVDELHERVIELERNPNLLESLKNEPFFEELLNTNDNGRKVPLTKGEIRESILRRREKVPEWKIRLLTNRSFVSMVQSFRSFIRFRTRGEAYERFKLIFFKHLPELLTGKKKIPDEIKQDFKEYKSSWKDYIKNNLIIDEEKLKYIAEQRKKKKDKSLTKQDKKEYHTTRKLSAFTEEEKKFLQEAFSSLKDPIKEFKEPQIPTFESTESNDKISDYIDIKDFPKISFRKPENPIPFPKFPKIPRTKFPDDPLEVEMEFVAKQRIKQIKSVLGELIKEKLLKKSYTARKLERKKRNFIDFVLKFYEKLTKDESYTGEYVKPVENISEEYVNSLTGLKFYKPKPFLEALLSDNAVKIALLPSQKDIHDEYNFYKQQIDSEVEKKLKGKKVDEVEYFIEYVLPFFEAAEKDPSEKKKRLLLLRLDEYSRLITRHPKLKSDREKYWDALLEDYKSLANRKDFYEGKLSDPSFNEEPTEQSRLRSLDEVLEEHGIFINSVMKRLFPLRRNRWFPNIIYGPNGETYDISMEQDIFKLKALSDSFLSVNKVINYGKSQFWMKQLRRVKGNNLPDDLVLENDPRKLVKLFVKTLLQMNFDKERFGNNLNNENLDKTIEEFEEKKTILKKYGTYISLIAALKKESGIKDILDQKQPSHSGDLYFEDELTKKELYTLLFLRACLDKSIYKYKDEVKRNSSSIDDIDEDLYQWLVDHYKNEPQTLLIQKAPPTKRRHKVIPDERSLVLYTGVSDKIDENQMDKIVELIKKFESLDPVQWVSVVRELKDNKDTLKLLADCLELADKYGLPTSEKYMKTAMEVLARTINSPIEKIREDYNLFLTTMCDRLAGSIDFGELEEDDDEFDSPDIEDILLETNLFHYTEKGRDRLSRYILEANMNTINEAKATLDYKDDEFSPQDDKQSIESGKWDEIENIEEKGEEKGEEEKGEEVKGEEEEIIIEEEEIDKTIELTEEERALLNEIFNDEKVDTILAEIRDEIIMAQSGIVPFKEDSEYTWSGFPYDVRDVQNPNKNKALTKEEEQDPVIQKVLAMNDPNLLQTTRLLKHIESGSTKFGDPLLIISELAYQIKKGSVGIDSTLPPRVRTLDPDAVQFHYFSKNGVENIESTREISEARIKNMGYDPVKFVFDVGKAIEGENIFAQRNPIDNSAIDLSKPIDEIPLIPPETPSLLDSIEFEIELRKALTENVDGDIKELIDEQYDKFIEKVKYEPIEFKETVSPIEEILIGEEEEEEVEKKPPEEKVIKKEEEPLDILDLGYGTVKGDIQMEEMISEEEKERALHLEGLVVSKRKPQEEEFGLSIGEIESGLAATKERVERFVKRGIFRTFGFGGKETAKRETDFLKFMRVVIPGFNYNLWLRTLKANFNFLLTQLKEGNLNYVRLIASEQVVHAWTNADYFQDISGIRAIIISSVYIQKDIPYCDIILKVELSSLENSMEIKTRLKIDYKNQLYFFLETWREKKEKPQQLKTRFGRRRYRHM